MTTSPDDPAHRLVGRFKIGGDIPCGFGRESEAILNVITGSPLIVLDPSEGEYSWACDKETAKRLVEILNACVAWDEAGDL